MMRNKILTFHNPKIKTKTESIFNFTENSLFTKKEGLLPNLKECALGQRRSKEKIQDCDTKLAKLVKISNKSG